MIKQKLYKGPFYDQSGYRGKRILVVGHEKHATGPDRIKYNNAPENYDCDNDNCEMIQSLIDGTWEKWLLEDPYSTKSLKQFGRMLSGNRFLEMGSEESNLLWSSIAFCNYLQVPDLNLKERQGKDEETLYRYSERIFQEYLEECDPDRIIVWGVHAYPYIAQFGINNDGTHCDIILASGKVAKVLRISHPSRVRGGYNKVIPEITEFLKG